MHPDVMKDILQGFDKLSADCRAVIAEKDATIDALKRKIDGLLKPADRAFAESRLSPEVVARLKAGDAAREAMHEITKAVIPRAVGVTNDDVVKSVRAMVCDVMMLSNAVDAFVEFMEEGQGRCGLEDIKRLSKSFAYLRQDVP